MELLLKTVISTLTGFVVVTCFGLYWYCVSTFSHWKKKGVISLKPTPLFGNISNIILQRRAPAQVFQDLYNHFYGEKFGGIYQARTPVLLLRDPELIKHVLVKDFATFPGKGASANMKKDPLTCHLFNLEGEQWRYVRTKLTPAFTSSKLKIVYQHIDHYSEKLIEHLEEQVRINDTIDMYETLVNFTMDATGSCAFGVEVNAMTDETSEFKKMGHRIIEANGNTSVEIIESISPTISKLFHFSTFPQDVTNFFKTVVKKILDYRDENHIVKKDVMHLLMIARNIPGEAALESEDLDATPSDKPTEKDEVFDEVMLTAQAAMFLRAGSEKASTTMCFCLNELAHQPELQSELRAEVEAAKEEHGGKLTYEIVLGLQLMDRVVSETLRKYPLEANIYRVCRKPYTIPETTIQLDEGTKILIPVYALHHDPEHFPDPERFDPDRFTDGNKNSRPHFTYLPFGEGPRVCIGFRYGVLQVKVGLAALLLNYEFSICPLSTENPELNAKTWITSPANGMWIKISKRQ